MELHANKPEDKQVNLKDLYTVTDYVRQTGKTRATIYRWVKRAKMELVPIHGALLLHVPPVEETETPEEEK